MKTTVIASSPTKEGLEKLINQYYYSNNYVIREDMAIYNTKTGKVLDNGLKVRTRRGRWQYYREEATA